MGSIKGIDDKNVLDDNLDGGGEPILIEHGVLDNEYAQMIQDLLEMRM